MRMQAAPMFCGEAACGNLQIRVIGAAERTPACKCRPKHARVKSDNAPKVLASLDFGVLLARITRTRGQWFCGCPKTGRKAIAKYKLMRYLDCTNWCPTLLDFLCAGYWRREKVPYVSQSRVSLPPYCIVCLQPSSGDQSAGEIRRSRTASRYPAN